AYKQHAVHGSRRCLHAVVHWNLRELLQRLAMLEDEEITAIGAEEHLAVNIKRRVPRAVLEIKVPVLLSGFGIETAYKSLKLGGIYQGVVNRHGADRSPKDNFAAAVLGRRIYLAAEVPNEATVLVYRCLRVEVVVDRRQVLCGILWLLGDI